VVKGGDESIDDVKLRGQDIRQSKVWPRKSIRSPTASTLHYQGTSQSTQMCVPATLTSSESSQPGDRCQNTKQGMAEVAATPTTSAVDAATTKPKSSVGSVQEWFPCSLSC